MSKICLKYKRKRKFLKDFLTQRGLNKPQLNWDIWIKPLFYAILKEFRQLKVCKKVLIGVILDILKVFSIIYLTREPKAS